MISSPRPECDLLPHPIAIYLQTEIRPQGPNAVGHGAQAKLGLMPRSTGNLALGQNVIQLWAQLGHHKTQPSGVHKINSILK